MSNIIDGAFSEKKKIRLMTHVVCGYPSMEKSMELVMLMSEVGVDMIEIQIPFSDPLADGPTIMKANQAALDNRITPDDCFEFAAELCSKVSTPVLFMTYANIPFRMGVERFIKRSADAGICGLIIPDIPFDEEFGNYYNIARQYGIYPIYVVSPDISSQRLNHICSDARGFIYTTLKTGITGAGKKVGKKGLELIDKVRICSELPIAAGFGISSVEHLQMLQGVADMAVIGSHVINLYNESELTGVESFLKDIISYIRA